LSARPRKRLRSAIIAGATSSTIITPRSGASSHAFAATKIKTTGDGVLATFDSPARGLRCACAIADEIRPLGIEIRASLHTGECEMIGDNVGGIAVHIGARVAAIAGANEVLVSSIVKDLAAGSGLRFLDRGSHSLKGIPGERRIFAVER
jgi:class 3 adenylate cyclase